MPTKSRRSTRRPASQRRRRAASRRPASQRRRRVAMKSKSKSAAKTSRKTRRGGAFFDRIRSKFKFSGSTLRVPNSTNTRSQTSLTPPPLSISSFNRFKLGARNASPININAAPPAYASIPKPNYNVPPPENVLPAYRRGPVFRSAFFPDKGLVTVTYPNTASEYDAAQNALLEAQEGQHLSPNARNRAIATATARLTELNRRRAEPISNDTPANSAARQQRRQRHGLQAYYGLS